MAVGTKNLLIPLILGSDVVLRRGFNRALEQIDKVVAPAAHLNSGGHWAVWKPEASVKKGDVMRTDDCYSYAYLECVRDGVTGTDPPKCPYGIDDRVADGSTEWVLRRIASSNKEGKISHKLLIDKNEPDQHQIKAITDLKESLDALKHDNIAALNKIGENAAGRVTYREKTGEDEAGNPVYEEKALATADELHEHKNKDKLDKIGENAAGRVTYREKTGVDEAGNPVYEEKALATADELHEHKNKDKLDKIGENEEGRATYQGGVVALLSDVHEHKNRAVLDRFTAGADGSVSYNGGKLATANDLHAHANKAQLDKIGDNNGDMTYNGKLLASKTDLHTHANKAVLDKFTESNNQPMYDGKSINGGAVAWAAGAFYSVNALAVRNGLLYRCKTDHTAADSFEASKWELLDIGYIGEWQSGVNYEFHVLVTHGNNILRCTQAHTSAEFNNVEKNYWEVLAGKGATLAEWQPHTGYEMNEAVIFNDIIYRCTGDHTSSGQFSADMVPGAEKWRPINGYSESGVQKQVTKLGVVAPKINDIVINSTAAFNLPPVEILKFTPGDQDQVITACGFDNADASDFQINNAPASENPDVVFDGTMRPGVERTIHVSDPAPLGEGQYYETDWINVADYVAIEKIDIY